MLFKSQIFRQEALEYQRRRLSGELDVRPSRGLMICAISAILMAMLTLYLVASWSHDSDTAITCHVVDARVIFDFPKSVDKTTISKAIVEVGAGKSKFAYFNLTNQLKNELIAKGDASIEISLPIPGAMVLSSCRLIATVQDYPFTKAFKNAYFKL